MFDMKQNKNKNKNKTKQNKNKNKNKNKKQNKTKRNKKQTYAPFFQYPIVLPAALLISETNIA